MEEGTEGVSPHEGNVIGPTRSQVGAEASLVSGERNVARSHDQEMGEHGHSPISQSGNKSTKSGATPNERPAHSQRDGSPSFAEQSQAAVAQSARSKHDASLTSEKSSNRHMLSQSEEEAVFKCTVCASFFANKTLLRKHAAQHEETASVRRRTSLRTALRSSQQDGEASTKMLRSRRNKGGSMVSCSGCCHMFQDNKALQWHTKDFAEEQFECPICKVIVNHDNFSLHILNHVGHPDVDSVNRDNNGQLDASKTGLQCEICSKSFRNKAARARHSKVHHQKRVRQVGLSVEDQEEHLEATEKLLDDVKDEDEDTAEAGLEERGNIEEAGSSVNETHDIATGVQCAECAESFVTDADLQSHMEEHEMKKPFVCQHCSKRFGTKANLHKHQDVHTEAKPHKCKLCSQTFKRKQHLARHMRTHEEDKPFECTKCGRRFSEQQELTDHQAKHTASRPFVCNRCSKSFDRRSKLTRHMEVHAAVKSHVCTHCKKAYTRREHLMAHVKVHTGSSRHQCSECGKACSSAQSLRVHKLQHDKEHPCPVCPEVFKLKTKLNKHMAMHGIRHTLNKTHQCEQCGKAFPSKTHLARHIMTHTGEKPHECPDCGRAFNSKSHLKDHIFTHSADRPFPCPHCPKSFAQRSNLRVHLMTHSGEKPYQCDACGYTTNRPSSLKTHYMMHSGERPYKCVLCSKGFTTSSRVSRHMRQMHKNEARSAAARAQVKQVFASDANQRPTVGEVHPPVMGPNGSQPSEPGMSDCVSPEAEVQIQSPAIEVQESRPQAASPVRQAMYSSMIPNVQESAAEVQYATMTVHQPGTFHVLPSVSGHSGVTVATHPLVPTPTVSGQPVAEIVPVSYAVGEEVPHGTPIVIQVETTTQ